LRRAVIGRHASTKRGTFVTGAVLPGMLAMYYNCLGEHQRLDVLVGKSTVRSRSPRWWLFVAHARCCATSRWATDAVRLGYSSGEIKKNAKPTTGGLWRDTVCWGYGAAVIGARTAAAVTGAACPRFRAEGVRMS